MKYIIVFVLFVLFLVLGCGTFKGLFGKEEPKETLRPPASHEVIKNSEALIPLTVISAALPVMVCDKGLSPEPAHE